MGAAASAGVKAKRDTLIFEGLDTDRGFKRDKIEYPLLPLPPSQVQARTLFTIPYGTAEHEVCDFHTEPGEGESVLYTLVAFRRLANGHFALLASRPGGGRLQIFNEKGELVKSAPMSVDPEDTYYICSDGMVFCVNRMMIEYAIGLGLRRQAEAHPRIATQFGRQLTRAWLRSACPHHAQRREALAQHGFGVAAEPFQHGRVDAPEVELHAQVVVAVKVAQVGRVAV